MNTNINNSIDASAIAQAQADFLTKVYAWMVGGLLITGVTAWFVYDSGAYIVIVSNSILFYGLILAELVLVLSISRMVVKLSQLMTGSLFLLFSLLNGITFSIIFAVYEIASIQEVFFIAAGMFAALSFYGMTTKKDMSGVGKFLYMGLFGLIIAIILNFVLMSSAIHFAISVIGVIIFAGLTIYDTKKLKEMYVANADSETAAGKLAIYGALTLYLDFINLFLFLLRLFGNRK